MAAVKGSLLVTAAGMDLSKVADGSRDRAVGDFHRMKTEAERQHDQFYALPELHTHQFSYGDFYAGFLYRSWPEFHADKVLASISQNTHQLIQAFSQCVRLYPVTSEAGFMQKQEPRAHSCYCNPQGYADYVGCITAWEEWHSVWYTAHPQDIDWNVAKNDWFPRQDLIIMILRRELQVKFVENGLAPEKAKQEVDAIAESQVVNDFHKQVMGHKGNALEGYASRIGSEICRCNYYTFEKELSSLEHQNAGSLREIYSIINRQGKIQFISIDFKHGMFEFHNENGDHLGEYRFDGSPNSGVEVDHGLKCLEQWRKKTGRR